MLVLSRFKDESIIIGDNIKITVVEIGGDKVRLGINAPTEIPVHRQEVYEAIQRENIRAAGLDPDDVANKVKVPKVSPATSPTVEFTSESTAVTPDAKRAVGEGLSAKPKPNGNQ